MTVKPKEAPKFQIGDEVETSGTERGYARGFVTKVYPQTRAWVYVVKNSVRGDAEHWWERQLRFVATTTSTDPDLYDQVIADQEAYERMK